MPETHLVVREDRELPVARKDLKSARRLVQESEVVEKLLESVNQLQSFLILSNVNNSLNNNKWMKLHRRELLRLRLRRSVWLEPNQERSHKMQTLKRCSERILMNSLRILNGILSPLIKCLSSLRTLRILFDLQLKLEN
jgi:uncharacterized protein YllA (UPF0747 family)